MQNAQLIRSTASILLQRVLEKGVFRFQAPVHEVRALQKRVLQEGEAVLSDQTNTHLLASFFLYVLREAQEPLLPYGTHDAIIATDVNSDTAVMLRSVLSWVARLDSERRALVSVVFNLLHSLAKISESNEMPSIALAHIFAPVLSRPSNTAFMSVRHLQGLTTVRFVIKFIIDHYPDIFKNPALMVSQRETPVRKRPNDLFIFTKSDSLFERISELPDVCPVLLRLDHSHPAVGAVASPREIQVFNFVLSWVVHEALTGRCGTGENFPLPQESSPPLAAAVSSTKPAASVSQHSMSRRKQMLLSCRRLRHQIRRFEEEFTTANERSPLQHEKLELAPVYAKYKELKRSIREGAAIDIQRFVRGLLVRKGLRKRDWTTDSDNDHMMNVDSEPEQDDSQPESHISSTSSAHSMTELPPTQPITSDEFFPAEDVQVLIDRKRELKHTLKAFDTDFFKRNGRQPRKADKEAVRPLYEEYNTLKTRIAALTNEHQHKQRSSAKPCTRQGTPFVTEAGVEQADGETSEHHVPSSRDTSILPPDSDSPHSTQHRKTFASTKPIEKQSKSSQQLIAQVMQEKHELHMFLKAYEKQFETTHKRKVKNVHDVKPVEAEFHRYKELKKFLRVLEGERSAGEGLTSRSRKSSRAEGASESGTWHSV